MTTKANEDKLSHEIWLNKMCILPPYSRFYDQNDDVMNRLVVLIAINKAIKTTDDLEYKAFCQIQFDELKQLI